MRDHRFMVRHIVGAALFFAIAVMAEKPIPGVANGYLLVAPMMDEATYLIDYEGEIVHFWMTEYRPGRSAYLLSDGSLLRTAQIPVAGTFHRAGGAGGKVERYGPDGARDWSFRFASQTEIAHHDIHPLRNGNFLMLGWDKLPRDQAIELGRSSENIFGDAVWIDTVLEIQPEAKNHGTVVWKWSAIDHLVQDIDPKAPNYGVIRENPHRIDFNYVTRKGSDWIHLNSVAYDDSNDQIMISAHSFSEIWVIKRGASANSKDAGLVARWGNSRAYQVGDEENQLLFKQHDPQWIEDGLPGEGNVIVFNNGWGRTGEPYSTILELTAPNRWNADPLRSSGDIVWEYRAPNKDRFFAQRISGVQRLPNGNTLICSGPSGTFFEVDPHGKEVWRFESSFGVQSRGAPLPPNLRKEKVHSGSRPIPFDDAAIFKARWYPKTHPGIMQLLQ